MPHDKLDPETRSKQKRIKGYCAHTVPRDLTLKLVNRSSNAWMRWVADTRESWSTSAAECDDFGLKRSGKGIESINRKVSTWTPKHDLCEWPNYM